MRIYNSSDSHDCSSLIQTLASPALYKDVPSFSYFRFRWFISTTASHEITSYRKSTVPVEVAPPHRVQADMHLFESVRLTPVDLH